MKKSLIILLLSIMIFTLMFACEETPSFQPTSVELNSPIKEAAVSFIETESAKYYFEDLIYTENINALNAFIEKTEEILILLECSSFDDKLSFAVTSEGPRKNPLMQDTIFLTISDLQKKDVLQDILDNTETNLWMKNGIINYFKFGEPVLKAGDLSENFLDFDGKFFIEEYNTSEELEKRSLLAASFIAYIDKTYGRAKLLQLFHEEEKPENIFLKPLNEIRNEWLKSLGADIDINTLPQVSEYLYQIRSEKGIRNLYIQTFDSIYFYIDIRSLESIDELNYLILDSFEAQNIVKDFFANFQVHNEVTRININMSGLTYAGIEGINFNLSNGLSDNFISVLVHEFTHYYINPSYFHGSVFSVRGTVQSEGLAEYVQRVASQSVFDKEFSFLKMMIVNHEESLYHRTFDKLNVWNEASINAIVFLDMRAILTILETDPGGYYIFPSAYKNGEVVSDIPNSYEQSASYVGYLVETYGMENFLSVYDDIYEYSAIYGKTYDEMVEEWLAYLESAYDVNFGK